MLKATIYKIPETITDKIYFLVDLLKKEKVTYQNTASRINNRQLRDSVSILAQENNQYSSELLSQLRILGKENINEKEEETMILPLDITNREEQFSNGYSENILSMCKDSEKKVILAYRSLLNEPFLGGELRNLIRRQLNGVLYAFVRLKLSCSTY